jgi:DNA-binding response OmpR family regulator
MASVVPPRVLIADTSARMRRVLRVNLEGVGCRVVEADQQSLPCEVRNLPFDAVVLDLDACDGRVRGALHVLRRRMPGAVIAGYSIMPLDDDVRLMCMDMFVEKPFDVWDFAVRLRAACDRATKAIGIGSADLSL